MMKETEADLEVKRGLWRSTRREVMGFARKHAAGHIRGERETEAQYDIAHAAKAKGYPMGLIRKASSMVRRGLIDGTEGDTLLKGYASKIGLEGI